MATAHIDKPQQLPPHVHRHPKASVDNHMNHSYQQAVFIKNTSIQNYKQALSTNISTDLSSRY